MGIMSKQMERYELEDKRKSKIKTSLTPRQSFNPGDYMGSPREQC